MPPEPPPTSDPQVTGIILRTRPLTETSLIVHWLTEECGRIATVAKGARRPKSTFRGKLDLFFRATFSFRRSRHGDLHTLREVAPKESFGALRTDLHRLQQISYATVLLERATETDTPVPELHDLFLSFLRHLDRHPPRPLNIAAWDIKFLNALGLAPDLNQAPLNPGAKAVLHQAASQDWDTLLRLKPSAAQWHDVERFLHQFLLHNLGHVPASRQDALGGIQ